mgnify:CR=1 FL=1
MSGFTRAELEQGFSFCNAAHDARRTEKLWREAGGRLLGPEQVRMLHRLVREA